MVELIPCPHCGNADAPSVHTLRIGHRGGHSFGWCDTNYGGCGAKGAVALTEDAAAAAWNRRAANAAPDPALLALAKFGATVIRECIGRVEPLTMDDVLALGWKSGICEGSSGRMVVPGVHDAIVRLLAPDGADGAGEVTDG